MKKQIFFETMIVVIFFSGIVYGVFAESYVIATVAAVCLGIALACLLAPSLPIVKLSRKLRKQVGR